MRQSISTRYIGPTDFRGSRVKATASGGLSKTIPWDDTLGIDENHTAAAIALCKKLGWKGKLVAGSDRQGRGNVFVFIHPLDIIEV